MGRIIENRKEANIVGERIREARIKAGLSQEELSVKLETLAVYVCRGSISRIENRERTVSDIEIEGMAKILNVPLDYLFGKE
ncbi:MAG: helix-turn-helix domain-containing protein [Firmicutes bacterium]|nr:helix-turn-helix domain-containing protein [Bacillota bacterium]